MNHARTLLIGKIFALLFITMGVWLTYFTVANKPMVTSYPESEISCILLAPRMNDQAWADLTNVWGPLDYEAGRVVTLNSGQTIGYSAEEDGDLWNLPICLTEG